MTKDNDIEAENIESENEDEEEEDDFDSECSVSSNLDSKLLEFVEQFRKETQSVVMALENEFFQLTSVDSDENTIRTIVSEMHSLRLNQKSNEGNVAINSRPICNVKNRHAVDESNPMNESRLSSAQQREEVLSLVQSQLSEIEESIRVSLLMIDLHLFIGFLIFCIVNKFFCNSFLNLKLNPEYLLQVRLSLQLSQELQEREERLSIEESRLQRSKAALQAREQGLATIDGSGNETTKAEPVKNAEKSETDLRNEIEELRGFKLEVVS